MCVAGCKTCPPSSRLKRHEDVVGEFVWREKRLNLLDSFLPKKMTLLLYLMLLVPSVRLELDLNYGARYHDQNKSWSDYPRHKPFYDNHLEDNVDCRRPARCFTVENATCLGTRLPYDSTTLDLFPEYSDSAVIKEQLYILQGLKLIPKCWTVVQPLLCSIFMPRCFNNTVELPSQDMCRIAYGPCRMVFNNHMIWPSFIKCEDHKLFPILCKNPLREMKFNMSSKCPAPLVPTDNALAVFEGVDGCGIPCEDPLYTQEEHRQIQSFISWAASICCSLNLFAVMTFIIDWRSANKYPALAIFYINFCFTIVCVGWLIQFTSGSRDAIVCRKDGTPRMSEPSGDLSCVIVFVLVYYFAMAAMVWIVIFTYAWHMTFEGIGRIQERIDKKSAYFHLLAWCLPLILTVTILAIGEIDGNSMTGICFVGYNNLILRFWFVLGPVTATVLIAGYFLFRSLIVLTRLNIGSQKIVPEKTSSKIRKNTVRLGLFTAFTFLVVVVTTYCHIYEFVNFEEWRQSFRNYIICSITTKYADVSECKMKFKPSAAKLQLQIFALFFAGVVMSSWVWTGSTKDIWRRFLRRMCNLETEEPVKMAKHKVIAQAFAKRKMFNDDGRLSITFQNVHEDPVGLNFDLDSPASQDLSSTWAAALPKLVTRRGALVGENSMSRRSSNDSQYSISIRRFSLGSRRNSNDSQFVSISELKAQLKASRVKESSHKKRHKKRSHQKRGLRKSYSKRGSTTSQESQLDVQILQIDATSNNMPFTMPNMTRPRPGGRRHGLHSENLAIEDAKRLIPFLLNQGQNRENFNENGKQNAITGPRIIEIEDPQINDSDSEPDERTKMLEPIEARERSKSKVSNKSFRSVNRSNDKKVSTESQTKYHVEDEAIMKHLLRRSNEAKARSSLEKKEKRIKSDSESSQISNQDSNETLPADDCSQAKEISTQTLPPEILEILSK